MCNEQLYENLFLASQPLFSVFHNPRFYFLCVFFILHTGGDIGLQLRLSARGTHHNGTVIFQQELEYIGLGQTIQTRRVV